MSNGGGTSALSASADSARSKRLKFPKRKPARRPSAKWFGRKPKKEGWAEAREAAVKQTCEVCEESTLIEKSALDDEMNFNYWTVNTAHVDHVVPERLILKLTQQNPHEPVNLMSLDQRHHGIKTSADRLLCKGDRLGFLQILRTNNWPMERVEAALAFYGM